MFKVTLARTRMHTVHAYTIFFFYIIFYDCTLLLSLLSCALHCYVLIMWFVLRLMELYLGSPNKYFFKTNINAISSIKFRNYLVLIILPLDTEWLCIEVIIKIMAHKKTIKKLAIKELSDKEINMLDWLLLTLWPYGQSLMANLLTLILLLKFLCPKPKAKEI